jgi:hypothetical protein
MYKIIPVADITVDLLAPSSHRICSIPYARSSIVIVAVVVIIVVIIIN